MTFSRPAQVSILALCLAGTGCASPGIAAAPEPVADAVITSGVKTAIGQSGEFDATDVDVATSEGIVQLSGFVSSADSVATVASVARTVKGVKSVKNELRLK